MKITSHFRQSALAAGALCFALLSAPLPAAPLIGINMDASGDDPHHARLSLGTSYVDAISSAGGIPVLLPPAHDHGAIARYVELCDGFVFTGGRDINPERYSETSHTTYNPLHPRRETFDFAMMKAVLASKKPVLGICLGCQELNVALGGSLIQDIPSQTSSTIDHKPGNRDGDAHLVEITTGSRLHDILGTTTLSVNSVHHQAVNAPGKDVEIMAKAPDGIVEAYRSTVHPFAMGIQWHPEALTTEPLHLKIYKSLVTAADKGSTKPL